MKHLINILRSGAEELINSVELQIPGTSLVIGEPIEDLERGLTLSKLKELDVVGIYRDEKIS